MGTETMDEAIRAAEREAADAATRVDGTARILHARVDDMVDGWRADADAAGRSAPRSPALSTSTGASSAPASSGAARRGAKSRECRLPRPQHAVERAVARVFYRVGVFVGRYPWRVALGAVLVSCALSAGLLNVTFEARSHKLYIPQRDFMAGDRLMLDDAFGVSPEPGILIVHRKDGGALDTKPTMLAVLDLHEQLVGLTAQTDDGRNVSFADVCYRRYIGLLGHEECIVSSPLELWWYQREQLEDDEDVRATADGAYDAHTVDFGTKGDVIEALQIKYFFEPRGETDPDGRYARYQLWEELMREQIFALDADGEFPLRISYWSTNYNEMEAQSFVKDDSYLMALSLVFIMLYVCITLGGVTADCRQTRLLLGSTCALCTGLAMASGFGIASMLGIPLQPISPIVCFTLLGVAVDDMIIIVMAFEAVDSALPDDERLGLALSRAGSTITVTSVTSTVAFLTGYFVDFPALAYFCVPASLCILMVYFLQMTLFAACLSLDAKRARDRRLDCCPCAVLTDDQVYRVPRMLGREPSNAAAGGADRIRPLQICVNKHWARILLANPMRAFVVVAFLALVGASAYAMRSLPVGLPPRLSLPDGSPIIEFIDDLDAFWAGTQMQEVQLVLRNADLGEASTIEAIDRAVGRLEALPFVLRFGPRWDHSYAAWRNCTWAQILKTGELGEGITLRRFLEDDAEEHTCGESEVKPAHAATGGGACVDDEAGFKKLSGGRGCALAVTHCKRGAVGWRIVQSHCAQTCGMCAAGAGANAALPALGGGVAAAAGGPPAPSATGGRGRFHRGSRALAALDAGEVTGGREFTADVVAGDGQVASESRLWFFVRMSNDNAAAWREYAQMRDELALEPALHASVYNFKYEFAYCDLMMPLFGLKNLMMAAATIFLVVYLFLPFSIALISTFTVVCIDVILLGLIAVSGLSLNTITLVTLLLALALAIDYSCHIGHAYVVAPGRTRKEKASHAIADIGFSIINAAGSTLLGTLFLAASQSPVFRIFFLLIWSTIFLGLISGMAFVPVVLSLIGPLNVDDDEHDDDDDHARKTARFKKEAARRTSASSVGTSISYAHAGAQTVARDADEEGLDDGFHTPKSIDQLPPRWPHDGAPPLL
ncbi:hypothetical protein KFE25_008006 [Diacronema lutheri]|uniref:SSD domain-containing protein n=2 Tax=Diacronema lutheri TaxID=2081491 RepID=A0A8J6C9K8_DIALT|nr:hypothetical protein KFE25_008006 [Diacronema lutheri]